MLDDTDWWFDQADSIKNGNGWKLGKRKTGWGGIVDIT